MVILGEPEESTPEPLRTIKARRPLSTIRHLEIGHAVFGEEFTSYPGANIGLDPASHSNIQDLPQGFIQLEGVAEHIPLRSNSLDRITSTDTLGYTKFEESLPEIVRVLKPGAPARIAIWAESDEQSEEVREILRSLPVERVRITKTKKVMLSNFFIYMTYSDYVITFRKSRD